jgi:hypothetical protein
MMALIADAMPIRTIEVMVQTMMRWERVHHSACSVPLRRFCGQAKETPTAEPSCYFAPKSCLPVPVATCTLRARWVNCYSL